MSARRALAVMLRAGRWALAHPLQALGKGWSWYRRTGFSGCWVRAGRKFSGGPESRPTPSLTPEASAGVLAGCTRRPLISIVTPVYRIAPRWLDRCIASVAAQHYRNWELLLVDDGSEDAGLTALMDGWASRDERIRLRRMERNSGIAAASNAGLAMASGEYVGFLDHDDELTPDALTWVVEAINREPRVQWLYSDEDKITTGGERHSPFFKPDYSPAYLLASMYTAHFSVYAASALRASGGLREDFEGSQDHDLALRLSESVAPEHVVHIPRILYHWRACAGSTARSAAAKPGAAESGRRAVREALARRGVTGEVTSSSCCPTLYCLALAPRTPVRVTVIVPTRNASGLLTSCLAALRAHTRYPACDVLVIDNQSDEPALLDYLAAESAGGRLSVMRYDRPFNHSEMNNLAVRSVDSELVVLMNNDVEVLSEGWLEQLVGALQMDGNIAGVGAQLLYPDGRVQHGGVVIGIHGGAGHAHRDLQASEPGYFGRLHCLQDLSAVTAALVLLRRSAFLEVGGFNPERYPNSFNDVDLWLRLRQRGYRCLYNPAVRGRHHETKTRRIVPAEEHEFNRRFAEDWRTLLDRDPFYNPNLSLENEQFSGFRAFPVEEQLGSSGQALRGSG